MWAALWTESYWVKRLVAVHGPVAATSEAKRKADWRDNLPGRAICSSRHIPETQVLNDAPRDGKRADV